MTSQAKFKLFIVIFVALLVLGGAGLFVAYRFFPGMKTQTNTNAQINTNVVVNQNSGTNTNNTVNTGLPNDNTSPVNVNGGLVNIGGEPLSDEEITRALARSFTERYGSFSNQNEFENLERLMVYMTSKLRNETQNFIDSQEGKDNSVYFGVTTSVISLNVDKMEEKRAVVLVATRRRESKEGSATTVSSETARVVMVKDSGEWLVDKFDWQ